MPNCPNCNSERVVPIEYGLLRNPTSAMMSEEEVVNGGCCYRQDSPNWKCKSCETKWYDGLREPEDEEEMD